MNFKAMKKIIIASMVTLIALGQVGCSAVMASKQPAKKDLSVIANGMPRSTIIAELGAPVSSEKKDDKRVDVYTFNQGYSTLIRVGRTMIHGVADLATLGLWEVVGTPMEATFKGTAKAFEVTYDAEDRVTGIVDLKK